jgi:hypothetical protein
VLWNIESEGTVRHRALATEDRAGLARPRRGPNSYRYFSDWLSLCAISECSWAVFEVTLGPRRFLTTLCVLALAMMLSRHLVALRGVLMVLGCLVMRVPGHVVLRWLVATVNASTRQSFLPSETSPLEPVESFRV